MLNIQVPVTHDDEILLTLRSERHKEEIQVQSGENTIPLFQGDYQLTFSSDDIVTHIEDISIEGDTNLSIVLDWYDILFEDSFESLDNWEIILGDWNIDSGKLLSQDDLVYPNFSPPGPIRINSMDIIPPETSNAALSLNMSYELEWDRDTLFVDIYNTQDSTRIFAFYDLNWEEEAYVAPL